MMRVSCPAATYPGNDRVPPDACETPTALLTRLPDDAPLHHPGKPSPQRTVGVLDGGRRPW